MTETTQADRHFADTERWDHYDRELARVHGDIFGRRVALIAKHTGEVIATYASTAAAFEALPSLPEGVRATAFLGWAEQASTRSSQRAA